MKFEEQDLVIIIDALGAYLKHIEPTAGYVKEVSSWSRKVEVVRDKAFDALKNVNPYRS
jgi:hypothetical protein